MRQRYIRLAAIYAALIGAVPAHAEDSDEPRRTRIGAGVQFVPSFPGAEDLSFRPLIDFARSKGREEFDFEAPDESFGFAVIQKGDLAVGPAVNLEGSRKAKDVGAHLPKVGFTVELGAFAQYSLSKNFRLRTELRKGIGGHQAWIGNVGGDYLARDADRWLFSFGPRMTFASQNYQEAYFGVGKAASERTGLPVYKANGGLMAIGLAASHLRQLQLAGAFLAMRSMTG